MITSDPPTITDLILSLGVPQNYAEQSLIHQMRRLAARQTGSTGYLTEQDYALWLEAHTIAMTIVCFRQHGARPPIDGYERMADRLERDARQAANRTLYVRIHEE